MSRLLGRAFGGLALAFAVAACGGSSSSSTAAGATSTATTAAPAATSTTSASSGVAQSAGGGALAIAADPSGQLAFTHKSLTAHAGTVTVHFTNDASFGHNFTVATAGGQVIGATPTFQGGTRTLSLHLKPGTYTFFCAVPGHRAAGMQGTLTVS